jgi:hypothetical protein
MIAMFGVWQDRVKKLYSFPPLVDLAIFTRHGWKVTAVLLSSFSAYTAISVSSPAYQNVNEPDTA